MGLLRALVRFCIAAALAKIIVSSQTSFGILNKLIENIAPNQYVVTIILMILLEIVI